MATLKQMDDQRAILDVAGATHAIHPTGDLTRCGQPVPETAARLDPGWVNCGDCQSDAGGSAAYEVRRLDRQEYECRCGGGHWRVFVDGVPTRLDDGRLHIFHSPEHAALWAEERQAITGA